MNKIAIKMYVLMVAILMIAVLPSIIPDNNRFSENAIAESMGEYTPYRGYITAGWHFNNQTGDIVIPDFAYINDNKYNNASGYNTHFMEGKFGNAYKGYENSYMKVDDDNSIELGIDKYTAMRFSVEFWVYIFSTPQSKQYIFYKYNSYNAYIDTDGKLYVKLKISPINDNTPEWITLSTTLKYGKWVKYTVSYDTYYFRLYENTYQRSAIYKRNYYVYKSSSDLYIGCNHNLNYYYLNLLDEFSIMREKSHNFYYITGIEIIPASNPIYTNVTSEFTIYSYNWFSNPNENVIIKLYKWNNTISAYEMIYETTIHITSIYYGFPYFFTETGNYKMVAYVMGDVGVMDTLYFDVIRYSEGLTRGYIVSPSHVFSNITFNLDFILQNPPYLPLTTIIEVRDTDNNYYYSDTQVMTTIDLYTVRANYSLSLPYRAMKYNRGVPYSIVITVYYNSTTVIGTWSKKIIVEQNPNELPEPPIHSVLLTKGWNLISLPSNRPLRTDDIFALNPNITIITIYVNGHFIAITRQDADITGLEVKGALGLYVYVEKTTTITLQLNETYLPSYRPSINKGWNLIGVPYGYETTARELAQKNPHIKFITIRKAGKYYTYVPEIDNEMPYTIMSGDAIYIYSDTQTEVIWE